MKIVLTLNELKSGNALLARIGIASDELNRVVFDMPEGTTLTQDEILKAYELDENKLLVDLNKNKNVMSVTKHMDGNGTTCFTLIISEDFICDINNLYGDCIVETFNQVKAMFSTLKFFFKDKAKNFLDKWKIK
jgi:hypothetical protein